jgi:glycosyltransferase involved in cell wall biosynthesis
MKGMRPRRIALVAAGSTTPGGQGDQARSLCEALRREGHDVEFVPVDPVFPRTLKPLRRIRGLRTILNEMLYLPRLRAISRADLALVFSASYWSFLLGPVPAILAARISTRRVVLVYHSGEAEDHLARWGRLVHPWLRKVDAIVVPSTFLQEIFRRHGYETLVIRNVVDTSRFRFRALETVRPRLLSTRNLEPHYRVDDTLRAFSIVKARYPEATLTVAGCGSEEARLRRLAESLGPDGIRFLGKVDPWDVPDLCRDADIFVNASVVDNQPVSVLEAFAAGLPVVTTPTGAIPSMVRNGETGILVPPRDPHSLASAITSLVESPERARRLASRAREEVAAYTWPQVREAWLKVSSGAPS